MLISFKRGQGSIVLRVKILDSAASTGAGKTGLTSASAGLIISTIADNEATATAYTVTGSTIETITTLGTYAAPTATKCRFKEVDATNHKGVYEIQIADARYAVSNAKALLVSIAGASGAAETDATIPLTDLNPYDAVRAGLTALPNAAAAASGGLPILGANATAISFTGGMTISNASGAGLTLSSGGSNGAGLDAAGNGTGPGIKATGGATGAGISGIGGATSGAGIKGAGTAGNSAGVEAAGQGSAAGLLSTGGATGEGIKGVGGATSGSGIKGSGTAGNAIGIEAAGQGTAAGLQAQGGATGPGLKAVGGATSGDAILANSTSGHGMNLAPTGTSKHGLFATGGNGGTSDGVSAVAGTGGVPIRGALTGNITGNVSGSVGSLTGHTPQTGDNFARLGAPVGASFSVDLAAVKTDTGNLVTRITSTLFSGITSLSHWLGALAGKQAANATAQTEIRASGAGSGTYDPTTDSQEALRDRGDAAWVTGTIPTAGENADAVLDEVVLGSYTMRQLLRGISAATMGKVSGAATTTVTIRDLGDTKNVIVATVDASGNRSALTLDLT